MIDLTESILPMLVQGTFVLNISGKEWHSIAIDEAHEMLLNKQCKMSSKTHRSLIPIEYLPPYKTIELAHHQ